MDTVQNEAAYFRRVQVNKYGFLYALNVPVANNGTLAAVLTIEEDADFLVEKFTGSAYGPTDVNGIRQLASATDFDLAGTAAGYADRGLTVKMTDSGSGRVLSNGYVPVETILTPGYGISLFTPFNFKYWIRKSSKILFDFRNRDTTAGGLYHFCSLVLHGYKYVGA